MRRPSTGRQGQALGLELPAPLMEKVHCAKTLTVSLVGREDRLPGLSNTLVRCDEPLKAAAEGSLGESSGNRLEVGNVVIELCAKVRHNGERSLNGEVLLE